MLNCDKARGKVLLKLQKRIILRSDRKHIQHVTVHVRSHDWEEPIQCESNVSDSSQVDWTLMQTWGGGAGLCWRTKYQQQHYYYYY